MSKNTCLFYAPVESYSGYAGNARDKIRAIIELKKDEWDIKIISCKWGDTPMGFLDENQEWSWMKKYIIPSFPPIQPDYMFWITIPPEAQPVGKWNCLITAGIETTGCDPSWIESINKMDLVIVPSEHSKNVFLSSKFEKRNKVTNNFEGVIETKVSIKVIMEGVNLETYRHLNSNKVNFDLSSIDENFLFLFMGHWMQGNLGHDRKNVGLMIKYFIETFKNTPNPPALLLKTSIGRSNYISREIILDRISQIKNIYKEDKLPNIYLLNGDLNDKEVNELYNHPKVKSMISFTKGEGYGRPLAEFCTSRKPVIASGWSGHTDFLDPLTSILIPGDLEDVDPSAVNQWIKREYKWFKINERYAKNTLKEVFTNYKKFKESAKKQAYHIQNNFSYNKMKKVISSTLNKEIPKLPTEVELVLPS